MHKLIVAAIRCALIFVLPTVTYASSAQWDLDPVSGDWNTAANWTPMGIPNGPADVATFGLSLTTDVSISANTEVNGITFTPAATNPFTITASTGLTLTISGVGITNNSGTTQHFVTAVNGTGNRGQIIFTNSASAGSLTTFVNSGATAYPSGGGTFFYDSSTANSATINNNGGGLNAALGGVTSFFDTSTAAASTINNNPGATDGGRTKLLWQFERWQRDDYQPRCGGH